jgi:ABC-2 family transporter protein
VIRWELYKLVRQRRTLFGIGAAALVPILFVAALEITGEGPPEGEAPFATQLLENGLVVPLVTLAFATFVLLPLVVAFVAGDAVAGEVSAGTLKTVLSRSVGRTELFFSKAAAVGVYCLAASAVLAGVGLTAGYLAGGFPPLDRARRDADKRRARHRARVGRRRPRLRAPYGARRVRGLPIRHHPQLGGLGRWRRGPHPAPPSRLRPRPRRPP